MIDPRLRRLARHLAFRALRRTPEARLAHVVHAMRGTVGVAALHLERGDAVLHCADRPFPMASLVKVPLAVHVLASIADGSLRGDEMISLGARDLRPGDGSLGPVIRSPGASMSVHELLRLALVESDNAASDVLFRIVGGPRAVQDAMRERGHADIRVDRTILEVLSDVFGVPAAGRNDDYTLESWTTAKRALSASSGRDAACTFLADPRDCATPRALASLLASIWRGEALPRAQADALLAIMASCRTGATRLPAMRRSGVVLAHKTGTLSPRHLTADIGIVRLPRARGHVAVAVIIAGSPHPLVEQEWAIAQLAAAALDQLGRSR